jgi:YD repeat-containing protein
MKKTFIVVLIILSATQYACKEKADKIEPVSTPEEICLLTQTVIFDDTVNYTYDNQNRLLSAKGNTRDITFEYNSNGNLSKSTERNMVRTFEYSNSSLPDRIVETLDGSFEKNIEFEYTDGLISKFEYTDVSNHVISRTELSYDTSGALISLTRAEYDVADDTLYPVLEVKNAFNDSKLNPYNLNFALRLIHLEEPAAVGKSNITRAEISYLGIELNALFTLNYNSFDLPESSTVTFDNPQVPSNTIYYTYDCPE